MIHKATVKSFPLDLLARVLYLRIHDQRDGVSWWLTSILWDRKYNGDEFSYEFQLEYTTAHLGTYFRNQKATVQDRLELIRLGFVPNVWPESDKEG